MNFNIGPLLGHVKSYKMTTVYPIKRIVIHCSATPPSLDIAAGYNRNAIVSNYMSIAPRSPGDDPWYDGGYGEVNGRTRALDSILRARQ